MFNDTGQHDSSNPSDFEPHVAKARSMNEMDAAFELPDGIAPLQSDMIPPLGRWCAGALRRNIMPKTRLRAKQQPTRPWRFVKSTVGSISQAFATTAKTFVDNVGRDRGCQT